MIYIERERVKERETEIEGMGMGGEKERDEMYSTHYQNLTTKTYVA